MQPLILSTKLFIPEIRDNCIQRNALVHRLVNGINAGNKLTLVTAPAGYGKTTLVLELLKVVDFVKGWISLNESDNDVIQFFSYLIAALKNAGVAISSSTEEVATDFNLASTNAPLAMIINDIAAQKKKIILALDDYHYIQSTLVSDSVNFLIEHQPPNLHLVIITREDPALPLPRLRAQGKISEIRMDDLSFSVQETADFFSNVMMLKLSGEAINAIAARTEGWVAGLQLVGLSLNGCEEQGVGEFLKEFHDTHRYIIDYLVEEVINRQTEEVREFLCKTSILGRMNGRLCDAVANLEKKGYLVRKPNPDDKRSQKLYATEKADALKNSKAVLETLFYRWLLDDLSDDDRTAFLRVLNSLYEKSKSESKKGFSNLSAIC
jgi:LuxR family maltose regulon positive regulatory protein